MKCSISEQCSNWELSSQGLPERKVEIEVIQVKENNYYEYICIEPIILSPMENSDLMCYIANKLMCYNTLPINIFEVGLNNIEDVQGVCSDQKQSVSQLIKNKLMQNNINYSYFIKLYTTKDSPNLISQLQLLFTRLQNFVMYEADEMIEVGNEEIMQFIGSLESLQCQN